MADKHFGGALGRSSGGASYLLDASLVGLAPPGPLFPVTGAGMNQPLNISKEKVIELVSRELTLPPLSQTASQLMRMLQMPIDSIEPRDLVALIREDPSMMTHVLSLANSPYMGMRRKISSVSHAVSLIGVEETIGVLNYRLLKRLTPDSLESQTFSPDAFWLHSWHCATAARMLGQPQLMVSSLPGELYMAGLLHDIGRLILAIHLPHALDVCMNLARGGEMTLHDAEMEVMGITHAAIGAMQLDQWNLPEEMLETVRHHHDPARAPESCRELSALIQYANVIAHLCELQESGARPLYQLGDTWIEQQGGHALTNPAMRDPLVKEITQTLTHREKYLDGGSNEGEDEDSRADSKKRARAESNTNGSQAAVSSVARPAPSPPRRSIWRSSKGRQRGLNSRSDFKPRLLPDLSVCLGPFRPVGRDDPRSETNVRRRRNQAARQTHRRADRSPCCWRGYWPSWPG